SADEWVQRALEQNLTVIANRFAVESAEAETDIARSGHLPTVDLVARRTETASTTRSSYFGGPLPPLDRRSTPARVGVESGIPRSSGGATSSHPRAAACRTGAARSTRVQAMRNAEATARDTYLGVISDILRVEALRQAYRSAQTALRATEAGYEVGTRTAVDVLEIGRASCRERV